MIFYGICLSVGLLQGVLNPSFIISALVSAIVVTLMLVVMGMVKSVDSVYSIGTSKMPITVFRTDFDYLPIDEQKSQSTTVKVLLLIAVNGLGVLVGTIGSQLEF